MASPTAPTSAGPSSQARPASGDPFVDTQVASFASGADGLVLPAAADTGSFTAAEVEAALQQMKKFMATAYLDPRVFGGDLGPVYAVVNDGMRRSFQEMAGDPSRQKELLSFAARFAPGVTLVLPDVHVKGTITYALGEQPGTLKIATNHVYVYPLCRHSFQALFTVHRDLEFTFHRAGTVRTAEEGIYYSGGKGILYWDFDCEAMKKGLLAPGEPPGFTAPEPGEPEYSERFDPTTPIAGRDIC
ncbi:hypothetical protein [Protofrankia symbiont of Coriaria ruscifolia]|uniref:hypothetical protein n=1 Tax=Protofrankia symbiont of Coriaria ruscifolia TaxID=1306542 RepID=UPI0013EF99F7|nr:hypothetical protein [Protofrankia symbiont of Coriaria ruscifolia]